MIPQTAAKHENDFSEGPAIQMIKIGSLIVLFGLTACLYAAVGFGGGSTYIALLVAAGTDYSLIPIIALSCNITVVSGNALRYSRYDLIPWGKLWPILLTSIPLAWLGGRINIPETLFIFLLAIALFITGIKLLTKTTLIDSSKITATSPLKSGMLGGGIGFFSGLVGIGGGIFLAPILYALNWGQAKNISAACSIFILLNSISGFAGQFMKLAQSKTAIEALEYWPLIPAVLFGGLIGNYLGIRRLSQNWVQRLTGILILIVAIRLSIDLSQRI